MAAPFLFFLPGYATLLMLRQSRSPARVAEDLYLSVLLSVLLVSPVGLLLAELGCFSLAAVILVAAGYSGLLFWLLWRRGVGPTQFWRDRAPLDRWDLALLALVMVAIPLYARPHEYVLGGADAGVYVNIGANLARTGRLVIHDPLVASTPPDALSEFFRQHPESSAVTFSRFPAFFIEDAGLGLVVPQFFHLHPMWMGLFYSMAGVWGALLITPLWALLGGVSVYFAAAAVFGRRTATLSLALLSACPLQIWFARYPTSEALTLFLLFGAIYATIKYLSPASGVRPWPAAYGLSAGLGWGALLLARIDTLFTAAVPGLILLSLLLGRQWQRRHWWLALPWALVGLQAALHAVLIANAYTHDALLGAVAALGLTAEQVASLIAAGLLVLCGLAALPRLWQRCVSWVTARRGVWSALLAALILLSASYAYLLRPHVEESHTYEYWYGEHAIQSSNHENLVRLGWYLSPLGVTMGTLGVAWITWRKLDRRTALFLGIGVFSSYLYLYNILNNPHHVYAMRRYVPAVVPTFLAGAAVFLDRLWIAGRRQVPLRVLAGLAGLALLGQLVWVDRVFLPQVDNQGLTDQLARLAAALPADDLILFDDTAPVGWGDSLGTALAYLYGRPVMTVRQERPDPAILSERLAAWTRDGRGVTIIPGSRPAAFDVPGWELEPAGDMTLTYSSLESSYTHMPQQVTTHPMWIEFYRVVPAAGEATASLPYRIDVGTTDFGSVLDGFYGKEMAGDVTFRWTESEASLSLPAEVLQQADTLILSLAAYRPEEDPVALSVVFDGTLQTTLAVEDDFDVYTVPLAAQVPAGDAVTLTLQTDSWSPLAAGVGEDGRDLGVMVDWVELVQLN